MVLIDRGITPPAPVARGQVLGPETPCIARVESGTPPAHEKGRSGQVNRAARALHTSWQRISLKTAVVQFPSV